MEQLSRVLVALLASFGCCSSTSFVPPLPLADDPPIHAFDWGGIPPSRVLDYHECYGGFFECARLEVPLDWSNLSNPNVVTLAVARLPAVVDPADASFGGSIMINPGGPGGSGIISLLLSGQSVQQAVDGPDKHFEILSFDPRGMQFSTPSLACFGDDRARAALSPLAIGAGSLESNPAGLNLKWSIYQSIAMLCGKTTQGRFPDGQSIRPFVGSSSVVRDMVVILDQAHASLQKGLRSRTGTRQRQQAPMTDSPKQEPPLLNYWGLSYGTYLGNMFASMFPERVGRMVLDGVVDADDHSASAWTTNLQDNRKTWAKFFEYCFEAGARCALFDESAKTPGDIQARVERSLAELRSNPLPVQYNDIAGVLTYFEVQDIIHSCLYQPILFWPGLAVFLDSVIKIDPSRAVVALQSVGSRNASRSRSFSPVAPPHHHILSSMSSRALLADEDEDPDPLDYPWHLEATASVVCGDANEITSRSKEDFVQYLELLQSQSPLIGAKWAEIALPCFHWPKVSRPSSANRFSGPFQSNLSDYDPRGSPLLFIGNTADPVTPLQNAFKMSARHEGSVVLTQDLPGHCSGSTNPSVCTFQVLKDFFGNGTLPKPGLVCEAARKPWGLK